MDAEHVAMCWTFMLAGYLNPLSRFAGIVMNLDARCMKTDYRVPVTNGDVLGYRAGETNLIGPS